MSQTAPTPEELLLFKQGLDKYRYDFVALAYHIFPFGQPGSELEHEDLYDWQIRELDLLSKHLENPITRYDPYKLAVSSGNGAAKTALGAIVETCLRYTQQLRARITSNTQKQMKSVIWPEYEKWFRCAKYSEHMFEKMGESIQSRDEKLGKMWRLDAVEWSIKNPAAISGLHNKNHAVGYWFEEAPGIPAIVFEYASGSLTDVNTIKVFLAFGNSDDPNSYFESLSTKSDWRFVRIDTRTLKHVDPKQIAAWLADCNGNEDHDNFRVRVRGLPRKSNKDAIIALDNVTAAFERRKTFKLDSVKHSPVVLTCDPAWQGGDECAIGYLQGHYFCLLEKYKLGKEDHMFTFIKLCEWEKSLGADAVFIDQAEGTGIKTLANLHDKHHWQLISFASSPNDAPEFKDSEFHNRRAQMYYTGDRWLRDFGVLDVRLPEWEDLFRKQLTWTKGGSHKTSLKRIALPKKEVKEEYGSSPDLADCFVLAFAEKVLERLPQNDAHNGWRDNHIGGDAYKMPDYAPTYEEDVQDADWRDL